MTKKSAILSAISIINALKNEHPCCEIQEQLNSLVTELEKIVDSLPLTRWTKELIFESIDQFIYDHKRFPKQDEFSIKYKLPSKTTVENIFGMKLAMFLKTYYPLYSEIKNKLYRQSKQTLLEDFQKEYLRLYPCNFSKYEKNKSVNAPSAKTIMRAFDIQTWEDLIAYCGLKTSLNIQHKHIISELSKVQIERINTQIKDILNKYND